MIQCHIDDKRVFIVFRVNLKKMLRNFILNKSSRLFQRQMPAIGRFYSAAPEPLSVQEIENRVLDTLKSFSKVDQSKVLYFI